MRYTNSYTSVIVRLNIHEGSIPRGICNRREYTEKEMMVIGKLIELSKHNGMTLEKAAKIIA
ncbi:hypothetical protein FA950_30130 [Bacillus thuringiensis]|nr:hypothetical protein FA950_30130 [Bacillus thuringiensis]